MRPGRLLLALAALAASGPGCAPRSAEAPLLHVYRAPGAVVLDGVCEEKEGAAANYGVYVACGTKKERRERHYFRAMFDDEFLYLAVDTCRHESVKTESGFRLKGSQVLDVFRLSFASEDESVFLIEILSDGSVCRLDSAWCPVGTEAKAEFVLKTLGLRAAAATHPSGSHSWVSEVQVPLRKLRGLGRHVWVKLSGTRFRLAFEQ